MNLLTLPIRSYLTVAKWPLETTLKIAGREDGPAALALDRVDGTVRTVVGNVFRDDALQKDGLDLLTAVEERTKAMRLRTEAELKRERANEQLAEDRERADAKRREATQRAEEQRKRADQQKTARKRQATEAERKRKQASERAEAKVQETIEDRAKRERLETLEQQAAALEKQDDALTARDEAERLAAAAGNAKEAR